MIEYSIKDIEAFVKDEKLTKSELELLPYVIENLNPSEITKRLKDLNINVGNATVRKRLGNIYLKFKIPGDGPGKLPKLRDIITSRIQAKKAQGKILISWSGSIGKTRAKSLCSIMKHSKIEIVVLNSDMNLGLQWHKEVEGYLDNIDICFVCLSENCYEEPMVNSAMGLLYGKIKQFKLLSFESKKLSQSSLSYFPVVDAYNEQVLAKFYCELINGDLDDAQELIEIRFKRYKWREEINSSFDEFIETEEEHDKQVIAKKNLLQIIGDKFYYDEEKKIHEIIDKSIGEYGQDKHWLQSISYANFAKISEYEKVVEDKLIEYFQEKINIIKGFETIIDSYQFLEDFPIIACVLRLKDENDYLVEHGSAAYNNNILEKRNREPRPPGKGYVQIVFAEKEPVIVPDISKKIDKFTNKEWINSNKIKSFASFPLMNGDEVMGTFTIYGNRIYDIEQYKDHLFFLKSITFLLTNLIIRLKKIEAFKNMLEIDKKKIDSLNIAEELKKIKDEIG